MKTKTEIVRVIIIEIKDSKTAPKEPSLLDVKVINKVVTKGKKIGRRYIFYYNDGVKAVLEISVLSR